MKVFGKYSSSGKIKENKALEERFGYMQPENRGDMIDQKISRSSLKMNGALSLQRSQEQSKSLQ